MIAKFSILETLAFMWARRIVVLLVFTIQGQATTNFVCENTLGPTNSLIIPQSERMNPTDQLMAYLEQLVLLRIFGETELRQLIAHLGAHSESSQPMKLQPSSKMIIHQQGFQRLLARIDKSKKPQIKLLRFANTLLRQLRTEGRSRETVRATTNRIATPISFVEVSGDPQHRGGNIDVYDVPTRSMVEVAPFEVMTTPVTQAHWIEIMGPIANPSRFQTGETSFLVPKEGGGQMSIQPDHPVEQVSWWATLEFANRLSIAYGYPPVYDLSGVIWHDNEVHQGRHPDTRMLSSVVPPTSKKLEGFRLPTRAEYYLLLELTGASKRPLDLRPFECEPGKLVGKTYDVKERPPFKLQGKNIYSLVGNVHEWGWDPSMSHQMVFGRNLQSVERGLFESSTQKQEAQLCTIGFRLVRSLGNNQRTDQNSK